MRTLTVKQIPDSVYRRLADWAKANHRSLQEQVRRILEREAAASGGSTTEEAERWRQRLADRDLGSMVTAVREDRER